MFAMTIGKDGKTYGSWPVLLSRGIEVKVGTRMGRYGGVMAEHEGNRFKEERDEFWEAFGWTITDPPIPARIDERQVR